MIGLAFVSSCVAVSLCHTTKVFAMGQVYVLFSRVTDPRHLQLIGLVALTSSDRQQRVAVYPIARPASEGHPSRCRAGMAIRWVGRRRKLAKIDDGN